MDELGPIHVNSSSSMVELKAELYRKQESFRSKKLAKEQQLGHNQTNDYDHNKCSTYKLGKRIREKANERSINKTTNATKEDLDLEAKREEENALKKSREMLEKKAKIYEEKCNSVNFNDDKFDADEEDDDRILVNFEQKAVEKILRQRKLDQMKDDENEVKDNEEEDEWTEFTDSLGRSRKCLKKDLPHFLQVDRETFSAKNNKHLIDSCAQNEPKDNDVLANLSYRNELLSDDLRRELRRNQWEKDASQEMQGSANSGPTHYQNVQFNEIRDHGAAYYAFSQDTEERKTQLEALNALRQQTVNQRVSKQKLKEKRKQMMRERLKKVAERKGIALEDVLPSSESEDEPEPLIQPETQRVPPTKIREWDVGKEQLNSEPQQKQQQEKVSFRNNYIEERRSERNLDFAPPESYFHKTCNKLKDKHNERHKSVNETDVKQVNCNIINNRHDDNLSCGSASNYQHIISEALSYYRNNAK